MNTDAPWPSQEEAETWVLSMQTKLHQWSGDDWERRFDDLYNLVYHPAVLLVAWHRVKRNKGAKTPGVDGQTAKHVMEKDGEIELLSSLRQELRRQEFRALPVRERKIPKANGKLRRLGIPTLRDRVVQQALKLVLEPIFEADFQSCSYGFRPNRRAQDAVAEVVHFGNRTYTVVLEGDIEACFDRIDHVVLMERVRMRIKDRKVLALVKAFLKAGILTELSGWEGTYTGTPQGGILSPLLANIALSILDDYYAQKWQEEMSTYHYRQQRLLRGLGSWRLVRYADDWVAMVQGTKEYAESLKLEIEQVLEIIGLRLSKEKTSIVTLDEGFDFLGFRIQRRRKRGTTKDFVYTRPSKQSLKRIGQRVHDETRRSSQHTPATMVKALNLILRGWTAYHKHGAAKDIFVKLGWYVIQRVTWWLRRRHSKNDNPLPMREVKRRFIRNGQFVLDGQRLIQAGKVPIIRYRYRGMNIPTPWTSLQV